MGKLTRYSALATLMHVPNQPRTNLDGPIVAQIFAARVYREGAKSCLQK